MLTFIGRKIRRRQLLTGVLQALPLALLIVGCAGSSTTRLATDNVKPVAAESAITSPAAPPEASLFEARKLFDLEDTRINESSGLGVSRRYPGVLWIHNDSGDTPRLFMVAAEGANAGKTIAEVKLDNATAIDWEDMAVAGAGEDAWVYVGDIGDNLRKRADIIVYRFREPDVDISKNGQISIVPHEKMTLTYPDGAHDAESLMATDTGELLIVSKVATGDSVIYKTPRPFAANAKQQLVRIGEFKFEATGIRSRLTTGGDLSPDGKHLVIRTYTRAYQWALPEKVDWTKVWPGTPQSWTIPETVQGEAICYSVDGQHIYVTSEQLPTPLYKLSQTTK